MYLNDRRYTSSRDQQAGPSPRSAGADSIVHRTMADPLTTAEATLLASARKGDQSAVGEIFDWHGTAVLALACAILRDREQAETVVIDVIAQVCTGAGGTRPAVGLRHNLARIAYLRCVQQLPATAGIASPGAGRDSLDREALDGAVALMTGLGELARQQRAAIALVMVGDHTYLDVARLLRLPPDRVLGLLYSSLRDLRSARMDDEGAGGHRAPLGASPSQ